jgi:hypothetical protein
MLLFIHAERVPTGGFCLAFGAFTHALQALLCV